MSAFRSRTEKHSLPPKPRAGSIFIKKNIPPSKNVRTRRELYKLDKIIVCIVVEVVVAVEVAMVAYPHTSTTLLLMNQTKEKRIL